MPRLKRRLKPDTQTEQDIITGMIVSDSFCRDALQVMKLDYFKISYGKTVVKWIQEYFDNYQKAPKENIQDIFYTERESVKEAEATLIEAFLDNLSSRFEEENFNKDYLFDRMILHFKEKSLENLISDAQRYINAGKPERAEELLLNYHKVDKVTSEWVNPFDDEEINSMFQDHDQNILFSFPGVLGSMVGALEREWLFSFLGPMKRGKTFWLLETAITALEQKLKVVIISLEMSKDKMKERTYKRLTGLAEVGKGGMFRYPVFDCESNQDNTCTLKKRSCEVMAPADPEDESDYIVCTHCREKNNKKYLPAVWYEYIKRGGITTTSVRKATKQFKQHYKDNFRLITYPAYSANLKDIQRDLEVLEQAEDFLPDVVIIDYADILAPERQNLSTRDSIDTTWKTLKQMAATKHYLMVTASQSSRRSIDSKSVKQTDTAEDIRKLAHVDIMLSLNQTPVEKKNGIIRLGVTVRRHSSFDEGGHVTVLQNLDVGQAMLDTERMKMKDEDEE